MAQQTWVGSDLVADVLLNDIPDNDTELYTRVGLLETEVHAARDGEASLLAKEDAQDSTTTDVLNYAIVIENEVHAARDGEASLLAKESAQDALTATVTAEVVAARVGKASLLAKQQEQDTQIAAAQVLVTTGFPNQSGKAFYTLKTDGTMPYWDDSRVPVMFNYEGREDLRALTPADKALAVVESLGLFAFSLGSDEPDDDESCFATSTGRWLLEAPHWDLIEAWRIPNEDYEADFLIRSVTCAITAVSTITSASFSGTILGAVPGDTVIVTPPAMLGATAADTGKLSYHAVVTAVDTVTVYLTNASASTATTNTAIRTAWPCRIIKQEI